jgi:alanine racemase
MAEIKRRAFIKTTGAAALAWPLAAARSAAAPRAADGAARNDAAYGSCDPWIEVDRGALRFNAGRLSRKVGGRPILAVLKCNAYGHGLVETARCLETAPVHGFVVGKLSEALALRNAGIRLPVLNLGPFAAADAETIVQEGISQSVYTDAVLWLQEAARKRARRAGVHVEIDTGLGRVGVPHEAALAYLHKVAGLSAVRIEGVFQSFSEEPAIDKIQLQRFLAVTEAARKEGLSIGLRHASASTAVFSYGEEFHLDAIRPGIALYGHYPTDEERRLKRLELRPALALKTTAAYVKNLKPGDSLSYFRKFVAAKPERVVTAALGYSDGVPQGLAGKASALVRGRRLPFIADVTANHSYLLATGHPEVSDGDEITLVGKQGPAEITLADLAEAVGVSDYKILIGLSPALRRTYRDR